MKLRSNNEHDFIFESLSETLEFGRIIGSICEPGDIICLKGGMGAGKTTLTQAVAQGAGVDQHEYITSPTFSVLQQYHGKVPIYHMDFYRLEGSDDIAEMGLDEYFYMTGICILEWCELAEDILPPEYLSVGIFITHNDERRRISLNSHGNSWGTRLDSIREKLVQG